MPDDVYYVLRAAWWELNSTTGLISTEPEFGSEIYENKITTFEAGKTYHYGVYVVAYGDVGNVRYVFGPDTKLKINGEFVNYKRYEGDASDGSDGTMWVLTDLTMTPEAGGTTPSEKCTVTYTDGVDNEEIFKDQTYTVESGKATPAFNGTPTRKGYTFVGWKPAVAATVTGNATYGQLGSPTLQRQRRAITSRALAKQQARRPAIPAILFCGLRCCSSAAVHWPVLW